MLHSLLYLHAVAEELIHLIASSSSLLYSELTPTSLSSNTMSDDTIPNSLPSTYENNIAEEAGASTLSQLSSFNAIEHINAAHLLSCTGNVGIEIANKTLWESIQQHYNNVMPMREALPAFEDYATTSTGRDLGSNKYQAAANFGHSVNDSGRGAFSFGDYVGPLGGPHSLCNLSDPCSIPNAPSDTQASCFASPVSCSSHSISPADIE